MPARVLESDTQVVAKPKYVILGFDFLRFSYYQSRIVTRTNRTHRACKLQRNARSATCDDFGTVVHEPRPAIGCLDQLRGAPDGTVESSGATAAAVLYAVFSVSSGGLATNTELLFAPFIVWAVAMVLPWWVRPTPRTEPFVQITVGAGFLLGLATFTKLIAVFDGAFVFLLLVAGWHSSNGFGERRLPVGWVARRLAAMTLGVSIPWIAGTIYFWLAGALGDFVFANFTL